mgnify:CR=1 FL=1
MEKKQRVLIVEDEKNIVDILRFNLRKEGYDTQEAYDGEVGLALALQEAPDLILLDLMLPKMNGFEVCKRLRDQGRSTPVIIITAREAEKDKILGLDLGADDYITKPFSPSVLVARIKAHLAQYDRLKQAGGVDRNQLQLGSVLLQKDARRVFVDGVEVALKNKEYELLLFLLSNPDIVFSKETLYERIWGYDAMGDNATVVVHINRLREKIEKDPSHPRYIQTVWGAGYRFKP